MDFPAPRHLSKVSTPLLEHTPLWHEKFSNSLQDQVHHGPDVERETMSKLQMLGASDYIIKYVESYFNTDRTEENVPEHRLPDIVNHELMSVDCFDTAKMSPSGSVAVGMEWHTLSTPSENLVIDADFCSGVEGTAAQTCLETLFDISGVPVLPVDLEQSETGAIDTQKQSLDQMTDTFDSTGGILWSDTAPIGYDCAGRDVVRTFCNQTIYDPRGTVLILPQTVDLNRFCRTLIGKSFVKVSPGFDSYNRTTSLINRGFNCVTQDVALGAVCLITIPTVNFATRLFSIKRGIHVKNPQNIRIDILLHLLYFQSSKWLTLFKRAQWRVGYVVEELEWAYPNG